MLAGLLDGEKHDPFRIDNLLVAYRVKEDVVVSRRPRVIGDLVQRASVGDLTSHRGSQCALAVGKDMGLHGEVGERSVEVF
jgi:hypothetical protein